MLIEFSVENFLSFKDRASLTMEADSSSELENNFSTTNNLNILKTSAIYGANASGKTNLIKAFTALILMVRGSDSLQIGAPIPLITPYAFESKTTEKPCVFGVSFIRNNEKYEYGVSATGQRIFSEYLKVYHSKKPTTVFMRDMDSYTFPSQKDRPILESIAKMTPSNKLFLSTATTWNYAGTKEARLWFDTINTYDNFSVIKDSSWDEMRDNKSELKSFMLRLLKEADLAISDFEVEIKEMDIDNIFAKGLITIPMIGGTQEKPRLRNIKVSMIHDVKNSNNIERYSLDFNNESSGTRTLFALAPLLKDAFSNPQIIIVDELEKSLHPLLFKYILDLFNNKNLNKASSQLIFTTHSTEPLDSGSLRRDQLWFTDKDNENGRSSLYSLSDFSVRKGENIRKGYLNNRYGGVPFISNEDK